MRPYEMAGGWRQLDEYLPATAAVTPADVQRAARRWLGAERRTTGILHPEKKSIEPMTEQAGEAG